MVVLQKDPSETVRGELEDTVNCIQHVWQTCTTHTRQMVVARREMAQQTAAVAMLRTSMETWTAEFLVMRTAGGASTLTLPWAQPHSRAHRPRRTPSIRPGPAAPRIVRSC